MRINDIDNYEEEEATPDEMESVGYTGLLISLLFTLSLSLVIIFLRNLFS